MRVDVFCPCRDSLCSLNVCISSYLRTLHIDIYLPALVDYEIYSSGSVDYQLQYPWLLTL